jgi:hypothetical protein
VPLVLTMMVRSADKQPGFAKSIDVSAIGYAALGLAAGSSVGPTIAELHEPNALRRMIPYLPLVGSLIALFWVPVLFSARGLWKSERRAFWILAPAASIPILAPFLLGLVTDAVSFNLRYVVNAAPAVLIAVAFLGRAKRWYLIAPVVAVELFGLMAYYFDTRHWKEDYRGVSKYLLENMPPDAPLYTRGAGNFEFLLDRPRETMLALDQNSVESIESRQETIYVLMNRPWATDPRGKIHRVLESAPNSKRVSFHGFDVWIVPPPS